MSVLHVSGLKKLIQCKNNYPFFSCWALFLWGQFPVSGSPSSCTNRSGNTAAGAQRIKSSRELLQAQVLRSWTPALACPSSQGLWHLLQKLQVLQWSAPFWQETLEAKLVTTNSKHNISNCSITPRPLEDSCSQHSGNRHGQPYQGRAEIEGSLRETSVGSR